MKFKVFIVSVFIICSLFPGTSQSQNKVVVIPLIEEAPPLEPFAPLTAESPPASAYFDNALGGHVTDKVTGLTWQKSDDDVTRNWNDAWSYCQDLTLPPGSWTDWRLPSIAELVSIVDYGDQLPTINSVFWGTENDPYWTATTRADSSTQAWYVGFGIGNLNYNSKDTNGYVRCVRNLSVRDNSFKNNANGTVSDLATGLMWQREDDNDQRNWHEANSYCQGLNLGGKQDWRLPNAKELQSIADRRLSNPIIDTAVFPNTNPSWYWSATTYAGDSGQALNFNFDNGWIGYANKNGTTYYVRCVR